MLKRHLCFFRHNCFFFGSEFFKDNTAIDRSRIVNLFYWLRARALALHNSFWLSASDRLFSFFKARGLRLIWPGHLQNMTRLPHPNLNAGKTTAIARLTTRFEKKELDFFYWARWNQTECNPRTLSLLYTPWLEPPTPLL